jgi:cobalamin biosynthesis protein CobT
MKKGRIPVIILTVANLILAGFFVFMYLGMDRTAPEFRFQTSDYIYIRSDGESELLQNISAVDAVDGDVTDRIVVEKVVENKAESSIVVFYAVSDKAGNVAKISRVFPAQFEEDYIMAQEEAEATPLQEEVTMTVGEEIAEPDNQEQEASDEEQQEEEAETEETKVEEKAEKPENTEAPEEETEQQPEIVQEDTSGNPVLRLKKKEVTIQAGTTPPWTELIEQLSDDKDNYTTLYYNLHISKFNSSKAGDYPVTIQAEDTDGHFSDAVTINVHVR